MCLCGNELSFNLCCQPFINGDKIPTNPEALMRSRYSAYSKGDAEYIYKTYAQEKQAENPIKEIAEFANSCQFLKLEVLETDDFIEESFVTFKVHYLFSNLLCTLHEKSKFIKENDCWKYLDGNIEETPEIKINRNDLCPCGSNKKFKKCHYK
ncbi:YchJ family protein [Pseudoalteromonas denitrificans]|uniref:SEC-C motif-containing protein n=1 Tax=Pseudoalteromonas denitrificans DSM 6059 TaxID=1123010 RepID=A0A1I1L134_9GAMM|nr:YchJ family metal-binding protein [Pseudoalteromonas denitrificans]SFC64688.1 SEC-C motif-containing protein [Pseudoalteromonas denitrificans DSM 6059]